MSILASLSLLFGIALGLRFNVRLLLAVCTLVVIVSTGAALVGSVGPGHAALFGALTIVALQVGYFVAMVISAMQLTDAPETANARRPANADAKTDGFEPNRG